jgi:transcriptional regulator with PAS, ATPase and Fis domain
MIDSMFKGQMTMYESVEINMLRVVFDALPSLVFVVDQDVRIQEYNAAANDLLMAERKLALKSRAGQIFHCIHSIEAVEGCGRSPSCDDCAIRNSVNEAFRGIRVVRRRAKIELIRDENIIEIYVLVTTSPFYFKERSRVLLVIEETREINELYRMISICSVCGRVQDDKESWMRVEAYFKKSWDVDFSHGYCPDCFKNEMDKIE